jgi:hypothetical protein
MSERQRLIAALESQLVLMERHATRLRAVAQHIADRQAQEDCRQIAQEAEDEAQSIRQQLEELGADDL